MDYETRVKVKQSTVIDYAMFVKGRLGTVKGMFNFKQMWYLVEMDAPLPYKAGHGTPSCPVAGHDGHAFTAKGGRGINVCKWGHCWYVEEWRMKELFDTLE